MVNSQTAKRASKSIPMSPGGSFGSPPTRRYLLPLPQKGRKESFHDEVIMKSSSRAVRETLPSV